MKTMHWLPAIAIAALNLTACSGGGGGGSSPPTANGSSTPALATTATSSSKSCLASANCLPTKIADGLSGADAMASSPSGVWILGKYSAMHIDPSGAKSMVDVEGGVGNAFSMAVQNDIVFWTGTSALFVLKPNETTAKKYDFSDDSSSRDTPTNVVASNGRIYFRVGDTLDWVTSDTSDSTDGSDDLAAVGRHVQASTVDSDDIYWIDATPGLEEPLHVIAFQNGRRVELGHIDGGATVFGLVTTPTHVIFQDYEHRRIVAFPKAGGDMTIVKPKDNDAFTFAADGDGVYWVSIDGVMAANIDGTNARVLVSNLDVAEGGITTDANAIYFTVPTEGAVYQLAK